MFKLSQANILERKADLSNIPEGKKLINTINAYSYNMALKDELFAEALNKGDALIPDGGSIVWTCHLIKSISNPQERCAGWDLFAYEMNKLNTEKKTPVEGRTRPVVMFLGSSENVLALIRKNAAKEYPNLVFEGHSTDYQSAHSLREMVEDGIAILKVGPALTFSLREGLFALSMMEKLLLPEEKQAYFIETLEEIMLRSEREARDA